MKDILCFESHANREEPVTLVFNRDTSTVIYENRNLGGGFSFYITDRSKRYFDEWVEFVCAHDKFTPDMEGFTKVNNIAVFKTENKATLSIKLILNQDNYTIRNVFLRYDCSSMYTSFTTTSQLFYVTKYIYRYHKKSNITKRLVKENTKHKINKIS